MKKYFMVISCLVVFAMLFLSACNNSSTENIESKKTQNSEESEQADTYSPTENYEAYEAQEDDTKTQEMEGNKSLDWPEITENGVDEELLFENLDKDVLETVAMELQSLVEETAEEEKENPEIVLTEGYIRVFKSERYKKVLSMGTSAMKPLYFIIAPPINS